MYANFLGSCLRAVVAINEISTIFSDFGTDIGNMFSDWWLPLERIFRSWSLITVLPLLPTTFFEIDKL